MNILVAPNSFKNAANAFEVAKAMERGLLRANPDFKIKTIPISDGGEYTLEILMSITGGDIFSSETQDPLGKPIKSKFGITKEGTGIIELAKASGIELLQEKEKNPLLTSTYGTGLLIREAIFNGCKEIILTLGGSASVDGGAGILRALGIHLLDKSGDELPYGGGNLIILHHFVTDQLYNEFKDVIFHILCDVANPLTGAEGAAITFAPQKGAGKLETILLDRCLLKFGDICKNYSGKDLSEMKGSGAAGGVAVGIKTFFQSKILDGTDYILNKLNANEKIEWADVIITAEGSLDSQTYRGKAPASLAYRSKQAGKKVICIAGAVPHRWGNPDEFFDAVFSLQNRPMSIKESIDNTLENITNTVFEIGNLLDI